MEVVGENFSFKLKHTIAVLGGVIAFTIFAVISSIIIEVASGVNADEFLDLLIVASVILIAVFINWTSKFLKIENEENNLALTYFVLSAMVVLLSKLSMLAVGLSFLDITFGLALIGAASSSIMLYFFLLAIKEKRFSEVGKKAIFSGVIVFIIWYLIDLFQNNALTNDYYSIIYLGGMFFAFLYRNKIGKLERILALLLIAESLVKIDVMMFKISILLLAIYFLKEDKKWI